MTALNKNRLEVQGHRGCRGLMPENTIPAFVKAVELGVDTLELDVVITADHKVLVSHEPYFSYEICKKPDGSVISEDEETKPNIYALTVAEVQQYDCGVKPHPRFPGQIKMHAVKPLLSEVFKEVEQFVKTNNLPQIRYNIEIKSTDSGDGISHPGPPEFVKLVMEEVNRFGLLQRVNLQSFDVRILQFIHANYPQTVTAFLSENENGFEANLKLAGYTPEIYSPHYSFLKSDDILKLQTMGMRVIPWTVNEVPDMQKLIDMGVDGIITDYPDRLIALLNP